MEPSPNGTPFIGTDVSFPQVVPHSLEQMSVFPKQYHIYWNRCQSSPSGTTFIGTDVNLPQVVPYLLEQMSIFPKWYHVNWNRCQSSPSGTTLIYWNRCQSSTSGIPFIGTDVNFPQMVPHLQEQMSVFPKWYHIYWNRCQNSINNKTKISSFLMISFSSSDAHVPKSFPSITDLYNY